MINFSQKVAIVIDGNNLEESIRKLQNSKSAVLNYHKFIEKILRGRLLHSFDYFREGLSISSAWTTRVERSFYGNVIPCGKDADIPIAMKLLSLKKCDVDTVILFSGDKDFLPPLEKVREEGIRVEIASIGHVLAEDLKDFCDQYHLIYHDDCNELN